METDYNVTVPLDIFMTLVSKSKCYDLAHDHLQDVADSVAKYVDDELLMNLFGVRKGKDE